MMESRKKISSSNLCPDSQFQDPPSSSVFQDISNCKTPKQASKTKPQSSPYSQKFFTALKNTPLSSCRRTPTMKKAKAVHRLKALELEQSRSARKVQTEKEKSLKSLARSLTVWLNFLFENPQSCGCNVANFNGEGEGIDGVGEVVDSNGKRERGPARGVGVSGPWRGPKRQRDSLWRGAGNGGLSGSGFSGLRDSLHEICSLEDLKERMRGYLSLSSCEEIFETMNQVTKNIDEGRLKMRAACPIVTDVGMKEKAIKILMCYNPTWLRIGLYIIFGGEALLPNSNGNSDQEVSFLRMIIEKQFFSHTGLAKTYAYNKMVEGLYRPGYYEKLGNVILKRLLLLAIILDRAKLQTSLPLKYGIDGLDGGSPLLFCPKSPIKSSHQLINDFLSSDVMHGEGNLLAHLVIVGYKVTYQQNPLMEYEFKITDLFEDLQDGVRLCRAIQLLKHDCSILTKVAVPSDTTKKNIANCGLALQYLRKAGLPLFDEEGVEVIEEDVVSREKELTLSLLWNLFVHLQLPLLVNKTLLSEEISKIDGRVKDESSPQTLLDLLLEWVKAVCGTYDLKVENYSSLLDGKAMWCLLDYYFRKEHDSSCSLTGLEGTGKQISIMSATEYTDALHNFILSQKLTSLLGNFPEVLQVRDILEYNGACNGRSVIVLLVFLSFQLLVKRDTDKLNFHKLLGFNCQTLNRRHLTTERSSGGEDTARNFRAIMSWWQDMVQQNTKCTLKPVTLSPDCFFTSRSKDKVRRDNAAIVIQSHYRRSMSRRNYLRIKDAVLVLQCVTRIWLSVKNKSINKDLKLSNNQESLAYTGMHLETRERYITFMIERHYFINLKRSSIIIQHAARDWISHKHRTGFVNAAILIQRFIRGWTARSMFNQMIEENRKALAISEKKRRDLEIMAAYAIQHAWKAFIFRKSAAFAIQKAWKKFAVQQRIQAQQSAAVTIQQAWKKFVVQRRIQAQQSAAVTIQQAWKTFLIRRLVQRQQSAAFTIQYAWQRLIMARKLIQSRQSAATKIQRCFRSWLVRKRFLAMKTIQHQQSAAVTIQYAWQRLIVARKLIQSQQSAATKIQSCFRGWLMRKHFLAMKTSATTIQSVLRSLKFMREFQLKREENCSALIIQSHIRGWLARKRFDGQRHLIIQMQSYCQGWLQRREFLLKKDAAAKIQKAFRSMNSRKAFHSHRNAAIDIQRFIRGRNVRNRFSGSETSNDSFHGLEAKKFMQSVLTIQRWWRNVLRLGTISATIIQSHWRGCVARQVARRERQRIATIQAYWKGYIARKHTRGKLVDLRLRVQQSAANVNDSMRLINRLISALSELLSIKSVSGILHTCATLDLATQHSQRCCEELVSAGAVSTLLKLIQSLSRSIPDQQVLKHALSTLRNLVRYPHLADQLIQSRGSLDIIVMEYRRNKEDGYFIASELLKKICMNKEGLEAIRKSPALLRRLESHRQELARKTGNDRRNTLNLVAKEQADRRLREAVELLDLINAKSMRH